MANIGLAVDEHVSVTCPCGKRVSFGALSADCMYGKKGDPFVAHELPYCDKFIDLSVEDYTTWLRKQLEN